MAWSKSRVNLVFLLVVAVLAATALTSVFVGSGLLAPASRPPSGESAKLPQDHPPIADSGAGDRLAALEQMSAGEPQNPEYLTQIADIYYDQGKYDKAIEFYQRSLRLHPKNPNVETDLATCLHYLGQDDKALEMLDKVLEYSPGFPQALFNKGTILASGKNNEGAAVAVWESLLRLDPDFPQRAEVEQRIQRFKSSAK